MTTDRLARSSHGVLLVLLASLTIGAWAVHLFALSSLGRLHQLHPNAVWAMSAVTVVTAIPCLLAIAVGAATVRRTAVPEGEGSPMGRTVFLSWMTMAIGSFNLLLIVLETVYFVTIDRHA